MQNNLENLAILSNKKVLCADDENGVLKNLVEILEFFFDSVTAVNNGEEALIEAESNFYDVIILDIYMPKIDGLEVIKQIRKKNNKVPIIILSAHTEYENVWKAVNLKITKYLIKPCNQNELFDALQEVAKELTNFEKNIKLTQTCTYNYLAKNIEKNKNLINLSKSESRLIEYFIKNSNHIVSYENIAEYMWSYEPSSKEAIKSIVKDLRKKIDSNFIKNVYGIGYICEI